MKRRDAQSIKDIIDVALSHAVTNKQISTSRRDSFFIVV